MKRIVLLTFMWILMSSTILTSVNGETAVGASTQESSTDFLKGVGEPLTYRSAWSPEQLNVTKAFEEMRSLNVSRLREWVWRWMVFNETGNSLNENIVESLNEIVAEAKSQNITVMGMVQDFPSWMTGIEENETIQQSVPERNLIEGSPYKEFLEKYEKSWETLAGAFPNITMWEIGNEYNLDNFLHGYNETDNICTPFNFSMKVNITTDLLYYGSLGVHEGNPDATTVMCGLGPRLGDIKDFLNATYVNINSGGWSSASPNDFFQIACWHPYFTEEPNFTDWIIQNEAIYEIMKNNSDGNKPVVFSEMGFSDNSTGFSREEVADCLNETFRLAKDNFPWLDTIYWFRLIDPDARFDQNLSESEYGYGLFSLGWCWKPAATTYSIVPEFPSNIVLSVFMVATPLAVIVCRRKRSTHPHARKATATCSSSHRTGCQTFENGFPRSITET